MGAVTQSLIIGGAEFKAEDLVDLETQCEYLRGAKVVRTHDQLAKILEDHKFSLVLHLMGSYPCGIQPADALNQVNHNPGNGPYVVAGKDLSFTNAADLMAAGATDCLTKKDGRSISDLVRTALEPARHEDPVSGAPFLMRDSGKIFKALGEGILVLDQDLKICASNPEMLKDSGYNSNELTGAPVSILDAANTYRHLVSCKNNAAEWRGELTIRRKDGTDYPAWAVMTPLSGEYKNQEEGGFLLLVGDMTMRKEHEHEIMRQANFDALTKLPNRNLMHDRMEQALVNAKRNKTRAAVMFIDLDHFKDANDTWGHATGDELLIEAAARMQTCVRESDTVARIGGDEFAVILTDVGEDHFAEKVAAKITGAIERPFLLTEAAIYLSASVGIAIYPLHGKTSKTLLDNADAAMYEVKRNGRRGYRMYGDLSDISEAVPIGAQASHVQKTPPELSPLARFMGNLISLKFRLPAISVFPAGLATASVLVLVGWLFASGAVSVIVGSPDDLMTESDMGSFGTASGPEETDTLPELHEHKSN